MMNTITSDMVIADILDLDKRAAPIFYANGLFCLGCPSASGESLKDACDIHGIDGEKLLKELNEYFQTK